MIEHLPRSEHVLWTLRKSGRVAAAPGCPHRTGTSLAFYVGELLWSKVFNKRSRRGARRARRDEAARIREARLGAVNHEHEDISAVQAKAVAT